MRSIIRNYNYTQLYHKNCMCHISFFLFLSNGDVIQFMFLL